MVIKLFSAAASTEFTPEPKFFDYADKLGVRKIFFKPRSSSLTSASLVSMESFFTGITFSEKNNETLQFQEIYMHHPEVELFIPYVYLSHFYL